MLPCGRGARPGAAGAVGAMAMTGMRVITTELGLVQQTPPQALKRQRARRARPAAAGAAHQRRGLVEAAHWAFGASGGAAFGALPRPVRRRPWAGPVYGLVVVVGLRARDRARPGPQPGQACAPRRPPGPAADHAIRPGALGDTPDRAKPPGLSAPRDWRVRAGVNPCSLSVRTAPQRCPTSPDSVLDAEELRTPPCFLADNRTHPPPAAEDQDCASATPPSDRPGRDG